MEALTIDHLSFAYPGSDAKALDDLTLSVRAGEFLVLCGRSGCGKTTLLRLLKREVAPHGKTEGSIVFEGRPLPSLDDREAASRIGMVFQDPDAQTVTDKVWHELAFGLENLGVPTDEIRLRVGDMAGYFGIDSWFREKTDTLSGGQKQLLNVASVMLMSPSLLLLDEPTSSLDPVAASGFISTLYKINRELGITVIIAEHRLEELFPIADRVAVLEEGKMIACDEPREVCRLLGGHPISAAFPASVRIFTGLSGTGKVPLTVREGRDYLSRFPKCEALPEATPGERETVLSLENVWFRYERNTPDILRGVNLSLGCGEVLSVLGGNGAGKTTLLKVISGIARAYRGKTVILGRNIKKYTQGELHRHTVAYLPQNVRSVFIKNTVRQDLTDFCRVLGYGGDEAAAWIGETCDRLGIKPFLDRHPFDLSGGEMQKCAIAKLLLSKPRILLLDEPTRGIDAYAKLTLKEILESLGDTVSVIMVTHDVEFAALVSDRCALFFDGEIVASAAPSRFFSENRFYTTAASRISRGIFDRTVTVDAVVACGKGGGA